MLRPTTINGFTFYVKPLASGADYVARENATGAEKAAFIGQGHGGYYEIVTDGRYVLVASDVTQGKHGQDDLVVARFDMQTKQWLAWQQPENRLWHAVSGPANPYWLWAKNGGSQPSTYPGDNFGAIASYRAILPR